MTLLLLFAGNPMAPAKLGNIDGGFLPATEARLHQGKEGRLLTERDTSLLPSREGRLL